MIDVSPDSVAPSEKLSDLSDLSVAKKLVQLKQSADNRGIAFNLKFLTIKKLMLVKKCYYTGRIFTESGVNARSIDRVDTSKGYIEGNVVACTIDINQKKTNLTTDEIFMLYKKIKVHHKKKVKLSK